MTGDIAIAPHPEGCVIDVWVVPGASRNEIVGPHDGALRIRVSAPPEGGKANKAVARLLAETLGGRKVVLESGPGSRRKKFVVVGMSPDEAGEALS